MYLTDKLYKVVDNKCKTSLIRHIQKEIYHSLRLTFNIHLILVYYCYLHSLMSFWKFSYFIPLSVWLGVISLKYNKLLLIRMFHSHMNEILYKCFFSRGINFRYIRE